MRQAAWVLILMLLGVPYVEAADCQAVATELKLPRKLKTRGKPKMLRWEDVDKTLNALSQRLQGSACSFTFAQVFSYGKDDALFPLTNSMIRIAPEDALSGLAVITKEGDELGPFEGRVRYERAGGLYARQSYSLYHFQYKGSDGQLHAVGSRLLLDEFGVKWTDLQNRVAIDTR